MDCSWLVALSLPLLQQECSPQTLPLWPGSWTSREAPPQLKRWKCSKINSQHTYH